jgi:tetratricopeptide (TPR) repeat protein
LAPDFAEPYVGRGFVHRLDGRCEQAVADFTAAIRLNPQHADAFEGRAGVYYLVGKFDESVADYTAAIRHGADYAPAYHGRAGAHSALGQLDQAAEDYHRAISRDPSNWMSHYFLADVLTRLKQFREALVHYQEAITLEPDGLDAEVFAFYAWLLATCPERPLRDAVKAVEMAKVACELTDWLEDQPMGILAAAYAANGDFAEAITWQEKACELAADERKLIQEDRLSLYRSKQMITNEGEP